MISLRERATARLLLAIGGLPEGRIMKFRAIFLIFPSSGLYTAPHVHF